MNWLAHIYFSDETSEEEMLGNFLGDFISRVPWQTYYDDPIKKGILKHFEIDKYATCHPLFRESCKRISEKNIFYSMILIDVFYDHFLAKYWKEFSDRDLQSFVRSFYDILGRYQDILPEKLLKIMPVMIKEDWLSCYRNFSGIQAALNRLAARIQTPNTIRDCLEELESNYDGLEADFRKFFSEMLVEFRSCENKRQQLVQV